MFIVSIIGKIKGISVVLFQSSEVANSNAMELEGLKRCISRLQEEGIEISDFTTDRHPQVKKYMREQHPGTNHWYDVWHVAKGVYSVYLSIIGPDKEI